MSLFHHHFFSIGSLRYVIMFYWVTSLHKITFSCYIFIKYSKMSVLVEYKIPVVGEEIVVRHTAICCSSDHSCTVCSFKVGFCCLIVPSITERGNATVIGDKVIILKYWRYNKDSIPAVSNSYKNIFNYWRLQQKSDVLLYYKNKLCGKPRRRERRKKVEK
jgi:hypothetical protein